MLAEIPAKNIKFTDEDFIYCRINVYKFVKAKHLLVYINDVTNFFENKIFENMFLTIKKLTKHSY